MRNNLDAWIDGLKLAIVFLLFLLGSEPTKTALIFLSAALIVVAGAEFYLLRLRERYRVQYEAYLKRLERAVKDNLSDAA